MTDVQQFHTATPEEVAEAKAILVDTGRTREQAVAIAAAIKNGGS